MKEDEITLPEKLKILGKEYEIILKKVNQEVLHWECDYVNQTITLYVDDTIKSFKTYNFMETLLHEMTHAILESCWFTHTSNPLISDQMDEVFATQFGRALYENFESLNTIYQAMNIAKDKMKPKTR